MLKGDYLTIGDKVAIVSLSSGILGEEFCAHELNLGIERLKELGLEPVFMPNSLKGMTFLSEHPESKAADLKKAILDPDIKAIITATGGDDTYKIIPYLMEDEEFIEGVKNNPKIFIGFSDTTINHLMFYHLGLMTFYGPSFLTDIAELDKTMLPYTKKYLEKLFIVEDNYPIEPSNVWYSDRESYDKTELGKPRIIHKETHGYEVLQGSGVIRGTLFGGCLESLYNIISGNRNKEEKEVIEKYQLWPKEGWQDKILFIETSEEKMSPEKLEEILNCFKKEGILSSIKGLIIGKPIDEVYYEEYKEIYKKVLKDINLPVMYNINFGHAVPRCIIPYGGEVLIDYDNKKIIINEPILNNNRNYSNKRTKLF